MLFVEFMLIEDLWFLRSGMSQHSYHNMCNWWIANSSAFLFQSSCVLDQKLNCFWKMSHLSTNPKLHSLREKKAIWVRQTTEPFHFGNFIWIWKGVCSLLSIEYVICFLSTLTCMYTYTYIDVCMHACTCLHMHALACMRARAHTHIHTHAHARPCMLMYIYIYI